MQEKFILMSDNDRLIALKELSTEIRQQTISTKFTEEEISEKKHELSNIDISIDDIEEEKKELVKGITNKLKAEKAVRGNLLTDIRKGYFEQIETVYDIPDHDTGIMSTYKADGTWLSDRKLTPKEKQTRILTLTSKLA